MTFGYQNSKGHTYTLHAKTVKRADGRESMLFYFSREVRASDALDAVPAGYQVVEMKTGLPALKKV